MPKQKFKEFRLDGDKREGLRRAAIPKGYLDQGTVCSNGGELLESRVLALKNKSGGQRIKVEAP